MDKVGFDNQKYLALQSKHIKDRIKQFGDKLYLEFGGKLYDDFHAARVLPGFAADSKLQMLLSMADQAELVIAISAIDIEKAKVHGDIGLTYDLDVLRLINIYKSKGLYVGSVVITQYNGERSSNLFKEKLEALGIVVYIHYPIEGYPQNVSLIVSDEGYGKNDYIKTTKPLVILTAPGPGSGKMAVCLSQLYHDHKHGIKAGYAKFETFPIWNIPLKHPINLAYEAATADLDDINLIDSFHLEAYGETAVNYNRDIEIFPVLNATFEKIYQYSPYKSPTDMGVNMVGRCIIDDDICCEASKQEIIRRYYKAANALVFDKATDQEVFKIQMIMEQLKITKSDRPVVAQTLSYAKEIDKSTAALELPDGHFVTGKTSDLLGPLAALLLNCVKYLGNIDPSVDLISPAALEPIQFLKTAYLGSKNPRLHSDEVLIALSVSAATDENARIALEQLPKLRACPAHTSGIPSSVDIKTYKTLGIDLTNEPIHELLK